MRLYSTQATEMPYVAIKATSPSERLDIVLSSVFEVQACTRLKAGRDFDSHGVKGNTTSQVYTRLQHYAISTEHFGHIDGVLLTDHHNRESACYPARVDRHIQLRVDTFQPL